MTNLWQERLRRHQLDQFKYLRLIFNDNFVLAFIVLIGALGFWYSNLLGTIHHQLIIGKPIVILLLFWQHKWWNSYLIGRTRQYFSTS